VTGLQQLRRFDPGLERDQLITQIGESADEWRSRLAELLDQIVPTGGAYRLVIPRVQRAEVSGPNAVNGGYGRAYQGWVEPGIGGPQVDPLVHPDLRAVDGREDASLHGAAHLRRRHSGGMGRLVECRRRAHFVLTGQVDWHLHRPAAVRRVQPPHQPLFAPRDRPVRQPHCPAQTEPPGQLHGIHQATSAQRRSQRHAEWRRTKSLTLAGAP
jgi:hypothetical protein